MTRDRFICTDCSAIAPCRSSRGTSVGRIALRPGAPSAFATPMANTRPTSATFGGSSMSTSAARPNDSTIWANCTMTSSRRRSSTSANRPPVVERNSNGPSCAKKTMPTNDGEPVSFRAYAPSTTFCIHVPMLDANVPR
jgi:hypothetical protein